MQYLRTGERELQTLGEGGIEEKRLEDYVVSGLVDFDDVSYDDHADLLYDLAAQTAKHFQTYLTSEGTKKVLRFYKKDIARYIHSQMQEHFWEEASGYETTVMKGFSDLKPSALRQLRMNRSETSGMSRKTKVTWQDISLEALNIAFTRSRSFSPIPSEGLP